MVRFMYILEAPEAEQQHSSPQGQASRKPRKMSNEGIQLAAFLKTPEPCDRVNGYLGCRGRGVMDGQVSSTDPVISPRS